MGRPIRLCLLIAAVVSGNPPVEAEAGRGRVRIAELLASGSSIVDEAGEPADWIEIENTGEQEVDLTGYTLSDDVDEPRRWGFPAGTRLAPGGRLLVLASGNDRVDGSGIHTDFRLDADGEVAILADRAGELVDFIVFPSQVRGVSYGRLDGRWWFLLTPSPGEPNRGTALATAPAPAPAIDPPGGFLGDGVEVNIAMSPGTIEVRFTTDGREPGPSSELWTGPRTIRESTVLRARAFDGHHGFGAVSTATFLVDPGHEIDVASLVTAPEHLFDPETGIYANPEGRGDEWERPASIEVFGIGGRRRFAVDAGVRIHGGSTRQSPKKSFRFYFRGEYGPPRLEYPLFEDPEATDAFEHLVLFMGTELVSSIPVEDITYLRRLLLQPLFEQLGQPRLHFKPVALYLNGEYWGLYFFLERPDEHFAKAYLGPGEWDVIEGIGSTPNVIAGDKKEWLRWLEALESGVFSKEDGYTAVADQVDLENITSYYVLFVWSGFSDVGLNLRSARARAPDGEWRFIPWDASAFRETQDPLELDTVGALLTNRFGDVLSLLFTALMRHEEYREVFFARLRAAMGGALGSPRFADTVGDIRDRIASEIPREAERWGFVSVDQWEANVDRISGFAAWRARSLPRATAKWFPALELRSVPSPGPLPPGTRIALIHPEDGLRASDVFLLDRLAARDASVIPVGAEGADPIRMQSQFDLAVIPHGVAPAGFESSWAVSNLPVVFSEDSLLGSMARLSILRGFATVGTVQLQGASDGPLTKGVPLWGLEYAQVPARLGFPVGALAEGARAVAVELRAGRGRTMNRAVVVAEPGAKDLDGRILRARIAYVANQDVRDLSGYGRVLFDRAVEWAATGRDGGAVFLRGDADGDGTVRAGDAVRLLEYLFRRGAPLTCEDAADADDDGRLRVTDAVVILEVLYQGGDLPAPYPAPGSDPTPDGLLCEPRR